MEQNGPAWARPCRSTPLAAWVIHDLCPGGPLPTHVGTGPVRTATTGSMPAVPR